MNVALIPILMPAAVSGPLTELASFGEGFEQMLGGLAQTAPGAETPIALSGPIDALGDAAPAQTGETLFDASRLVAVLERQPETKVCGAIADAPKSVRQTSGAEPAGSARDEEAETTPSGEVSILQASIALVPESPAVFPAMFAVPSVAISPESGMPQLAGTDVLSSAVAPNTAADAPRTEDAVAGENVKILPTSIATVPENSAVFLAILAVPFVANSPEGRTPQLASNEALSGISAPNIAADTPWRKGATLGKVTKTLPVAIAADTTQAIASIGDSPAIATMIASEASAKGSADPARIADTGTTLTVASRTAYAQTETVERQLDLARDERWVNQLARDIVSLSSQTDRIAFRLHPERLGQLDVQLAQSEAGLSIRMTTEHRETQVILAQAQPRLVEDMRSQGLRVAQAEIFSGSQGEHQRTPLHQDRPALIEASPDDQALRPLPTSNEPVSGRFA
jgi:flagellar hook-length control protein FliK